MPPIALVVRSLTIRAIGDGTIIGIAVAGSIIGCIILSGILILAIRVHHHRALSRMTLMRTAVPELGGGVQVREGEFTEVPRPKSSALRRSFFPPYNAAAGWGALSSRENVHEEPLIARLTKRFSATFSTDDEDSSRLSWPLPRTQSKTHKIPLKKVRMKHLSAILESPRSERKISPEGLKEASQKSAPQSPNVGTPSRQGMSETEMLEKSAVPSPPTSPPPSPHASPTAGASPSVTLMPKPLFSSEVNDERVIQRIRRTTLERPKSDSLAISANALPSLSSRGTRPRIHSRSMSVCSQKSGIAPEEPVPPLPLMVALHGSMIQRRHSYIERSPSRHSSSSIGSATSSILTKGVSPAIRQTGVIHDLTANEGAHIRSGPSRKWAKSVTSPSRPQRERSNVARFSGQSSRSSRLSRASTVSSVESNENRLSLSQLKVADVVRLSRISLSSSPSTPGLTLQQFMTPKRPQIQRVSSHGSPAERRKSSVLQDVSGNQAIPSRQASENSLQSSARSSGGNPFQWDPTIIVEPLDLRKKPSALKGSPTARKGHKRQNCVRISTLAPTVLGAHRKSVSPSRMNGIQEESPEQSSPLETRSSAAGGAGLGFSSTRSLPRPPSTATFAPEIQLNPTSLRAAVNTGSPTLSFTDYCRDQDSISTLPTFSSPESSPARRRSARHSNPLSLFNIPTFPAPTGNAPAPSTQMPVFSFTRPSMSEDGENTPPFAFDEIELDSDFEVSSSPAFAFESNRQVNKLDPSWPVLSLTSNAKQLAQEYDPESPALFYPALDNPIEAESPILRPSSPPARLTSPNEPLYNRPDSPTLSPDSLSPKPVVIPGLTTLYNPITNYPPLSHNRSPDFSINRAPALTKLNPSPLPTFSVPDSPTLPPSTAPSSSRKLSSLHGPRQAPAEHLRRSVMALRRMNSEANTLEVEMSGKAERRYLRLGREASPALGGESPDLEVGGEEQERCRRGVVERRSGIFGGEPPAAATVAAAGSATGHGGADSQHVRKRKSLDEDGEEREGVGEKLERPGGLQKRDSSVWDDGEKFWESPPTVKFTGDGRPSWNGSVREGWTNGVRFEVMGDVQTPTVRTGRGGSMFGMGTPRSLYDADGFLRT